MIVSSEPWAPHGATDVLVQLTHIPHLSSWLRYDDNSKAHTDRAVRSVPESDAPRRLVTLKHSCASNDAASRSGRRGVRIHQTNLRCTRSIHLRRRGGLRNLPSRLHPELIIPCEIGHRTAKAFVLLLQSLKLFELIRPHATVQFAQTIIRLFHI